MSLDDLRVSAEHQLQCTKVDAPCTFLMKYQAHYGTTESVTYKVWQKIREKLPSQARIGHLLWTQFFLFVYPPEEIGASFARATPKTWRKWVSVFLKTIATNKFVSSIIFLYFQF